MEENVATEETERGKVAVNSYPNPTDNYVTLDIENPEGKNITVYLFDATGKPVKTLFDGPAKYSGKASLSFALHTLPAGQYLVQVMLDRQEVVTRNIVKL